MTEQEFSRQIEAIAKKDANKLAVFEKNLLAIVATYSAPLAKKLLEINTNEHFNLYTGKDPIDINIIAADGSRYMYENPVSDVEKQLESFEKAKSGYKALFIYGLGNGVLLKGILGNLAHSTTVVFEPEIEIIYIVLHLIDFSAEITGSRLVIFQTDVMEFTDYYSIVGLKDMLSCARLYSLYITSPFYERYTSDMSLINENMTKAFMQHLKIAGNDGTDSMIGVNHTTLHIPDMLEGIPLSHIKKQRSKKTKTAIIVSTGPSLDKQLELLKKVKDHATIISVDASYSILKAHGIKPDFVTTMERAELTAEFFNSPVSAFDDEIIFCATTLTHPNTVKYLKGRNSSYIFRPLPYEFGFDDENFGYLCGGPSAAHFAFDLAAYLEHEKIIFIGQDLAYGKDRSTHAVGHTARTAAEKDKKQETEYTTAYGGDGMVETMATWNLFRQYFEGMIHETKSANENLLIYNCTEGGARIAGTIEAPFKEILEKEVLTEIKPYFSLPKKLNERQKEAKYKKYSKHVKTALKYGEKLQKKCEKLFLKLAKQIELANKLKAQGKNDKINYEKLKDLALEIDDFKLGLDDKIFESTYFAVLNSYIINQELELTAILARPSHTDEERKEKLFLWVSVHGTWLFNIAGGISVMRENIENCSQQWLR
nr:6-hydroxymethylpterin diphosphokinase MptE-like protein [uncultured Campylobacter sp.]